MQILRIGEPNIVQAGIADSLTRLAATDATLADATVSAQLYDEDMAAVGGSVDLTATGTNGIYQGTLPATNYTLDAYYWLVVTIGGTGDGSRRIKCQAAYHGETP